MFHERKWWVRRIWQECRSDGHWDPSIGPLPAACLLHSATICQDHIYLLGYGGSIEPSSMLVCSLADLLQSCRSQSGARLNVWHKLSSLHDQSSSCATLCGQLLAVGGCDDTFRNHTATILLYNPATNSWEVISHMPPAQSYTLVAVLPGNKLMVVGGYVDSGTKTDVLCLLKATLSNGQTTLFALKTESMSQVLAKHECGHGTS